MHEFELRILSPDGATVLSAIEVYLNADRAIIAAYRLANGRLYEVWCDDRCVYSGSTKPQTAKLSSPVPVRSTAIA
jgi:hypothetical protein